MSMQEMKRVLDLLSVVGGQAHSFLTESKENHSIARGKNPKAQAFEQDEVVVKERMVLGI
ncbi:uncharacterized protein N7529_005266 [Penicillium soppii]|uniref:uncharacterized protein n=1 Tax=Penicillium soppii TaxID=69789 RepID=UPI002548DB32|nr:uncharacterized protein N7529_005266 [Penicillium soppii]KAJ5872913.1 hypothetical protein N7529_005266 [Penicillium soppii]